MEAALAEMLLFDKREGFVRQASLNLRESQRSQKHGDLLLVLGGVDLMIQKAIDVVVRLERRSALSRPRV